MTGSTEWEWLGPAPSRQPTVRDSFLTVGALVGAHHADDHEAVAAVLAGLTPDETEAALKVAVGQLVSQMQRHGPGVAVWLDALATVDPHTGGDPAS